MRILLTFQRLGVDILFLCLLSCQRTLPEAQQPSASPAPFPAFQTASKFGFIDQSGKMVIPPEFESADSFSEGLAFVKQGKRVGYINAQGKFALRSRLDPNQPFSNGLTQISLPNARQGFIDKTGTVVLLIPFVGRVGPFWQGLAIARDDHFTFGIVNRKGQFVVKPQFTSPSGEMDVSAKPTFPDGLELMNRGGYLADKTSNWPGQIVEGTWVYLNRQGQTVIQKTCFFARPFSEGLAAIDEGKWNGETMKSVDRWGFIDRTGKFAIPPQFDYVESFSEGLAIAGIKVSDKQSPYSLYGHKFGYVNQKGQFVIAPQFQFASAFSQGLAAVSINGKYGYIDRTGRFTIPPQFKSAYPFSNERAKVSTSEGFGYIDRTGRYIVKPQFGTLSENFSEGFAVVEIESWMSAK